MLHDVIERYLAFTFTLIYEKLYNMYIHKPALQFTSYFTHAVLNNVQNTSGPNNFQYSTILAFITIITTITVDWETFFKLITLSYQVFDFSSFVKCFFYKCNIQLFYIFQLSFFFFKHEQYVCIVISYIDDRKL